MMTTTLTAFLAAYTWLSTHADSNLAFAVICLLGLCGVGTRFCLIVTLVVHLALML